VAATSTSTAAAAASPTRGRIRGVICSGSIPACNDGSRTIDQSPAVAPRS
jgi:hypothetical protein